MSGQWLGPIPTTCDVCHRDLNVVGKTFIDGRTIFGPWAIMCQRCHSTVGTGIGTGRGQEYTNGAGTKIAG